jgi:hypothetical protein
MADKAVFNNVTEETIKKLCMVYELLANQKANPYGVQVTVNTTVVRKENASA